MLTNGIYTPFTLYLPPMLLPLLWRTIPSLSLIIEDYAPTPAYPQLDTSSVPLITCLYLCGLILWTAIGCPAFAWTLLHIIIFTLPSLLSARYEAIPRSIDAPSFIIGIILGSRSAERAMLRTQALEKAQVAAGDRRDVAAAAGIAKAVAAATESLPFGWIEVGVSVVVFLLAILFALEILQRLGVEGGWTSVPAPVELQQKTGGEDARLVLRSP
jgi:hypothetical protein